VPGVAEWEANSGFLRERPQLGWLHVWAFAGARVEEIPAAFVARECGGRDARAINGSIPHPRSGARIGEPCHVHDPSCGSNVIAGDNEGAKLAGYGRRQHQDKPLALGERRLLCLPPQWPRRFAAAACRGLDLTPVPAQAIVATRRSAITAKLGMHRSSRPARLPCVGLVSANDP
jgi:hypothetical protein